VPSLGIEIAVDDLDRSRRKYLDPEIA
jgi:hypothetical protein